MSKNRAAYFQALGLKAFPTKPHRPDAIPAAQASSAEDPGRAARKAALDRSHEIRKFEIELYWKRATYFWVLQAAVFTALGLIWKDEAETIPFIAPVALAALGLLTSAAGWFSAQGSKFWQENWERHIDLLEDEFEGKLHKTAWVGRMGVRWSVSSINDRLLVFFVAFWALIFVVVCYSAVPKWTIYRAATMAEADCTQPVVIASAIATLCALFWLYEQKSNLRGSMPHWEAEPKLAEIQPSRPRLLKEIHHAPFIAKRRQAK